MGGQECGESKMEGIFGYGMSERGQTHEALAGTREVSAHWLPRK